MSRILLDTHAVLWAFQGSSELSTKALKLINDPDTEIFVSPISAYELALKANLGRLPSLPKDFSSLAKEAGFGILPITAAHFELAGKLPLINRDLWDRLLSAQAIVESIPLISCDANIAGLGAEIIW